MTPSPTGGGGYPGEERGVWVVVLAVRPATAQVGQAVVETVVRVATGTSLIIVDVLLAETGMCQI